MKRQSTLGKRVLKPDGWHDDRGLIPVDGGPWDPPMTDEEIACAARSDPDAQPTPERDLATRPAMTAIQRIRRRMGLTQREFAGRYHIPLGTLRDWEQGRVEPDTTAQAYITVIETAPLTVQQALEQRGR